MSDYGYQPKTNIVPQYWQAKYEKEAHKNWDKFYKRNTTNFFKDRHWISKEFEELIASTSLDLKILEVGCGVGNTVFPIIEKMPNVSFFAIDFAPTAIELVKSNPLYTETNRCQAFVCDVAKEDLPSAIEENSLDFVTMIFVLSAIAPEYFTSIFAKISRVLKPGGIIFFRDYADGDEAQHRFDTAKDAKKLADRFYVRHDGTRSYFFTEGECEKLCADCGLEVKENYLVKRQIENKKLEVEMHRVWIQGKYMKKE